MIDTALTVDYSEPMRTLPKAGLGYAGFTPAQRAAFLAWLDDPSRSAMMAFQQLYLASLEVALLEGKREAHDAQRELLRLDASPAWHGHELLDRAILLSFWLQQDGKSLFRWIANVATTDHVLVLALGALALLRQKLDLDLSLPRLMEAWRIASDGLQPGLLALRFASLSDTLGSDPLTYALAQAGESAKSPLPWRCAHRDLRIALSQPNLRPILEPLLREMLTVVDGEVASETAMSVDDEAEADQDNPDWNLILEFEESRSAYFDMALKLAQQQPGYSALLDEKRRMIYRIQFKRNKLRPLWRLWDWVRPWSGTRVYVNGEEVDKTQVWEHSPLLNLRSRIWQKW